MRSKRVLGAAAIACIVILAVVIQSLVSHGITLVIGLPGWVLIFIGLQISLSVTAAWMAQR
jgi:hypothetical protein